MSTLDDKILGEKLHYYCSSSESEDEAEAGDDYKADVKVVPSTSDTVNVPNTSGSYRNTGPKGVIDDWQRYVQLRNEQKEEAAKEQLELAKKLSLTCRSVLDDEKDNQAIDKSADDDFLKEYRKKRIMEMLAKLECKSHFGQLVDLKTQDDFLQAIDDEEKTVTVVIHLCDDRIHACREMNRSLSILAQKYTNVKFCKVHARSVEQLSVNFKMFGLPALLIYKNKNLIANFVKVTDELGNDFSDGDVENLLLEHAHLGSHHHL